MIDTIKIRTPYISEYEKEIVKSRSIMRQSIELETGLVLNTRYNSRMLLNTHHYTVAVDLRDYEWVSYYPTTSSRRKSLKKIPSKPYLMIECSLAKFIQGHNVYGGTLDISCVQKILDSVSLGYGIDFFDYEDCNIERIDIGFCYRLNDVELYLKQMKNAIYSRRENGNKSNTNNLYFAGSTTTVKFYNKYFEYLVHDYKKTKDDNILKAAEQVLRVEVEFKKRKLKDLFGKELKVDDIDMCALILEFDKEVKKIYNKVDLEKKSIRHENVLDELIKKHDEKLAYALYSSYMIIIESGVNAFKMRCVNEKGRVKNKYYRHMRLLRESNINIFAKADYEVTELGNKEFNNFYPSSVSERII